MLDSKATISTPPKVFSLKSLIEDAISWLPKEIIFNYFDPEFTKIDVGEDPKEILEEFYLKCRKVNIDVEGSFSRMRTIRDMVREGIDNIDSGYDADFETLIDKSVKYLLDDVFGYERRLKKEKHASEKEIILSSFIENELDLTLFPDKINKDELYPDFKFSFGNLIIPVERQADVLVDFYYACEKLNNSVKGSHIDKIESLIGNEVVRLSGDSSYEADLKKVIQKSISYLLPDIGRYHSPRRKEEVKTWEQINYIENQLAKLAPSRVEEELEKERQETGYLPSLIDSELMKSLICQQESELGIIDTCNLIDQIAELVYRSDSNPTLSKKEVKEISEALKNEISKYHKSPYDLGVIQTKMRNTKYLKMQLEGVGECCSGIFDIFGADKKVADSTQEILIAAIKGISAFVTSGNYKDVKLKDVVKQSFYNAFNEAYKFFSNNRY